MPNSDPGAAPEEMRNADPELISTIVTKYRELDANRDGMLNFREMADLLKQGDPTMTDREIKGLFNTIDRNGTGRIDLGEFTAFVFDSQPEENARQQRISAMKAKAREFEKEVQQLEVYGCSLSPDLNGNFTLEYGKTLNGKPVFDRGYPQGVIFFGFTEGRRLVGWFCAKKAPSEGHAVKKFKMFNASRYADTPNMCSACWENSAGRRDKRMVMEATDREEWDDDCKEGTARANELFGNAEEEAEKEAEENKAGASDAYEQEQMNNGEEEGWESEWYDQAGEDLEDHDSDSDYSGGSVAGSSDAGEEHEQFVDTTFKPDQSSLGGTDTGANAWTKLSKLHDQACMLKTVGPDDVIGEESSGNKWFLSAIAVASEYPAWIRSIFGERTRLERDGKYSVRLYHPGQKTFMTVEVDDNVPTKDGAPVFAGVSMEGEIWVPLLEKAFAKICKSYKLMGWGSVSYGLLYLCGGGGAENWRRKMGGLWGRSFTKWQGKASDTIDRKRAEGMVTDGVEVGQATLWLLMRQYMELCYPTAVTVDKAKVKTCGLKADRAYSVIALREVQLEEGHLRLVRIRNSFGHERSNWRGRWSDDSEAWVDCPVAFNTVKFKRGAGRSFWMSWNDFLKYFEFVDVVKKSMPIQGAPGKLHGLKKGLEKFGMVGQY